MRLLDIDNVEGNTVAILFEQSIERGNLPAEWRSSIAAEDQDHGAPAQFGRKANGAGFV